MPPPFERPASARPLARRSPEGDILTGITLTSGGTSPIRVGPSQTYKTIQAAIDAAPKNSLILVEPGVYYELVIMWKPVRLQGYGEGSTNITAVKTPAEKLMAYNWPGNVRELENCMEHAVALARFDQITVEDLPEKIRAYRAERFVVAANDPTEIVTMDELERRYILRVLSLVGGNKSRAAQVLGFDRRTLYRKLERYGDATAGSGSGAPEPPPIDA